MTTYFLLVEKKLSKQAVRYGLMLLFITFLSVFGANDAIVYDHYSMYLTVNENGEINEKIECTIINKGKMPLNKIKFVFGGNIKHFKAYDKKKSLKYDTKSLGTSYEYTIYFSSPVMINGTDMMTIEFTTKEYIRKIDNVMDFQLFYKAENKVNSFNLYVQFPTSYSIGKLNNTSSLLTRLIYPEAIVETNEKALQLNWKRINLEKGDSISFFAKASKPMENMSKKYSQNHIILVFMLGIIVSLFVLMLKSQFMTKQDKPTIFSVFNDEEKRVLSTLLEHDGVMMQNSLAKKSDFSKSKLSRILLDLEERNVVLKIKKGNMNKISLREDLKNLGDLSE